MFPTTNLAHFGNIAKFFVLKYPNRIIFCILTLVNRKYLHIWEIMRTFVVEIMEACVWEL